MYWLITRKVPCSICGTEIREEIKIQLQKLWFHQAMFQKDDCGYSSTIFHFFARMECTPMIHFFTVVVARVWCCWVIVHLATSNLVIKYCAYAHSLIMFKFIRYSCLSWKWMARPQCVGPYWIWNDYWIVLNLCMIEITEVWMGNRLTIDEGFLCVDLPSLTSCWCNTAFISVYQRLLLLVALYWGYAVFIVMPWLSRGRSYISIWRLAPFHWRKPSWAEPESVTN